MRRLAVMTLILAAGCKPESSRLADELDRSSSWIATVAAIGRTTEQNSTPLRFTRNAIDDASVELSKTASSLATIKIAPDIAGSGRRIILASAAKLEVLRADLDASASDMHGNIAWLEAASDSLSELSERARKREP
jgi:hypothetical protein